MEQVIESESAWPEAESAVEHVTVTGTQVTLLPPLPGCPLPELPSQSVVGVQAVMTAGKSTVPYAVATQGMRAWESDYGVSGTHLQPKFRELLQARDEAREGMQSILGQIGAGALSRHLADDSKKDV